jgi:putative ABC transport system ATP-binding protein
MIRLSHVTKSYIEASQPRVILHDVSIEFAKGEMIVLLGKSGSGKSTLLNLIAGIDDPTSGDVFVQDVYINRLTDTQRTLFRRKNIGFIFQAFNLIPTLSVLENVTLPAELNDAPRKKIQLRAEQLIAEVGLMHRIHASPDRLSGGEQQRVAIARALMNDPSVVLADEPTGNLDSDTGAHVIELLDRLTRRANRNLVMVTHSEEMIGIADRTFHLRDGALVQH